MTLGPEGTPSFFYFTAAISDPAQAVAATARLVSRLPQATVRHVTPLSPSEISGLALKAGEVRRAR